MLSSHMRQVPPVGLFLSDFWLKFGVYLYNSTVYATGSAPFRVLPQNYIKLASGKN
jgi:hypothetical protein